MDRKIQVKKELIINKNVEDVWNVMGNQFAQVHLWCTNFKASKPGGEAKFPGLDYSQRITITDRGETIQELDSFDTETHILTYHISKGAPSIAKHASAVWSLKSKDANKTTVIIEFEMETKGLLGIIMGPLIKKGMGKSATEITEELKYYLENGKPHPKKLNQ